MAQIGSTWVSYFGTKNTLLQIPFPKEDSRSHWVGDLGPMSVRYTTDVRLLFYRSAEARPSGAEGQFNISNRSWPEMLDSIGRYNAEARSPSALPFVMPIGLSNSVLHDMMPLIVAGGETFVTGSFGHRKIAVSTDKALSVLLSLSKHAVKTDAAGTPRRVISFPEMGHEEAVQAFLRREFSGSIEPPAFLKRWWTHDTDTARGSQAGNDLWRDARVAALPTGFKGGSDIVVTRDSRHPQEALKLATFLVSDSAYTSVLAEFGNLPPGAPGYGIDQFLSTMNIATGADRNKVKMEIEGAIANGVEYPDIPEMPTDIESAESLEALQALWRRLGDYSASPNNGSAIRSAAVAAEDTVNRRIDQVTRLRLTALDSWPYLVASLLGLVLVLVLIILSHRRRAGTMRTFASTLKQAVLVRGFAASALVILDTLHELRRFNPYKGGATPEQADKALIVSAGLRGWRRGQDQKAWAAEAIHEILWRAILLSIDSVVDPTLFDAWEHEFPGGDSTTVREFLGRKMLRDSTEEHGRRPFCFSISDSDQWSVSMPFMLEQALVCVLQNALLASKEQNGTYRTVTVVLNAQSRTVTIANSGMLISHVLASLVNGSPSIKDFEARARELLAGPVQHRPGIGLVEAYCIALRCYGGLSVVEVGNEFVLDTKERHESSYR